MKNFFDEYAKWATNANTETSTVHLAVAVASEIYALYWTKTISSTLKQVGVITSCVARYTLRSLSCPFSVIVEKAPIYNKHTNAEALREAVALCRHENEHSITTQHNFPGYLTAEERAASLRNIMACVIQEAGSSRQYLRDTLEIQIAETTRANLDKGQKEKEPEMHTQKRRSSYEQ